MSASDPVAAFREAEAAYHRSYGVEIPERWFEVPQMGISARYLEVGRNAGADDQILELRDLATGVEALDHAGPSGIEDGHLKSGHGS